MINRSQVREEFDSYTSQFDGSNLLICNKKKHTFRVADNCEWIARELRLNDNEVEISWLIGLLHDIGRFEQVKQINGYTDATLDHADLGAHLLFDDGMIGSFIDDREWSVIIHKAVKYHNKLDLPDGLDHREKLFCNIIRDADKIDIFRGFCESDFASFHERTLQAVQESEISDGVMQCFCEHRTIPHSTVRTDADYFLMPFALIFGIVFDCSFKLIRQQGFFERMLSFEFARQDNKRKFVEIVSCIDMLY